MSRLVGKRHSRMRGISYSIKDDQRWLKTGVYKLKTGFILKNHAAPIGKLARYAAKKMRMFPDESDCWYTGKMAPFQRFLFHFKVLFSAEWPRLTGNYLKQMIHAFIYSPSYHHHLCPLAQLKSYFSGFPTS